MRLPRFTYLEPRSVAEALRLLSDHPNALLKAGGTDLIPRLKRKLAEPKFLINLKGLSDLDYIRPNDQGGLRIGALTPLRNIESSPLVRDQFKAFAEAVASVASTEIRNIGTLGGNICQDTRCQFYNQSPFFRKGKEPCIKTGGSNCYISRKGKRCHALFCADVAPMLIAVDAKLKVVSADADRDVYLEDFYTGDGKTPHGLLRGQIVVEIQIPEAFKEAQAVYLKHRFREGPDYPVVGVAVSRLDGRTHPGSGGIRIVIGGATSGPFRCSKAETVLGLERIDNKLLERAGETAADEIPITSYSGCSVAYRRALVRQLVIRGVQMVSG